MPDSPQSIISTHDAIMFMLGAYGQCEQWPFVLLEFEIDHTSERESFSRERKQKQKPSSRKKKYAGNDYAFLSLCLFHSHCLCFLHHMNSWSVSSSAVTLLLTLLLKWRSKSKTVKMYPACQDPMWVPVELEGRMCREVACFWQLATATLLEMLSCRLLCCLSELAVASYRRWTTFLHMCTSCYSNGVVTLPAGGGGNPIHWG